MQSQIIQNCFVFQTILSSEQFKVVIVFDIVGNLTITFLNVGSRKSIIILPYLVYASRVMCYDKHENI